jgi:hypothetical protein
VGIGALFSIDACGPRLSAIAVDMARSSARAKLAQSQQDRQSATKCHALGISVGRDGRIAGPIRGGEDEKSCQADFNVERLGIRRWQRSP